TGPDLAREGNKNPNAWHYLHFMDPRSISPGSNMPAYRQFAEDKVDFGKTESKIRALRTVGVPFKVEQVQRAEALARAQAEGIAKDLSEQGITVAPDSEMVAIVAYVQSLGLPAEAAPPATATGQTNAAVSH
ncbi:MAG: cbb3-type cytochrome c oxidase subunit II, partial [Myxococcales bacterium]|nr:cbb3-type cytochrome c oxidase subunit II [Myxococcales bacterium]